MKRLDWDSDFFGFEVGEIIDDNDLNDANDFQLLILKQIDNKTIEIENFENTFAETKVIFSKKLQNTIDKITISDTDFEPLQADDLYDLAYESGKQSRFLLDKNFGENKFKDLYKKWIDNSLNKQFADKTFYIKNKNSIAGFVSIKKHQNHATIGLIAVDATQQGQGIGKKLLQKAEQFCVESNLFELQIPTQKSNVQACGFYTKNGYKIIEETIIKHYWNR